MPTSIVRSPSQLPDIEQMPDTLGIDVETTQFGNQGMAVHPYQGHRVCGVGIVSPDGVGWYVPLRHKAGENVDLDTGLAWLRALGKRPRTWVNHNIKFDGHFLGRDGIVLEGGLLCTLVLSRLVDPLRFKASLDAVGEEYLPEEDRKDDTEVREHLAALKTRDYACVPVDVLGRYCCQDAATALQLRTALEAKLPPESAALWKIEQRLTRVLLESERRGAMIDKRGLQFHVLRSGKRILELEEQLAALAGGAVDVLSHRDLTRAMERLCIQPIAWTDNGQPSWDAVSLRAYNLPATTRIAELKELYASISSFGQGWLDRIGEDGALHANFRQAGTRTGRLSCQDPNLQNVPKEARAFIVPRQGYGLVSIDFSQVEFRLFAHYTRSPRIIERYRNDAATDYHRMTAEMLGIERSYAKTVNFAFIYGMGRERLQGALASLIRAAERAGEEKMMEALRRFNYGEKVTQARAHTVAANVYIEYHRLFPEIRQFAQRVEAALRARGQVRNLFGRVYRPPEALAHKLRNWVIQGSAGDLLKDRMVELPPVCAAHGAHMVLNVHDELVFEVPVEEATPFIAAARQVLEHPSVEIRVPLLAEAEWHPARWSESGQL